MFTFVPALVALGVVVMTLFGHDGLLRRHQLTRKLERVRSEAAEYQRENEQLRREILRLQQSRTAIERAAAEQLLMAGEGAVIYRFHEDAPVE